MTPAPPSSITAPRTRLSGGQRGDTGRPTEPTAPGPTTREAPTLLHFGVMASVCHQSAPACEIYSPVLAPRKPSSLMAPEIAPASLPIRSVPGNGAGGPEAGREAP